MAHCAIGGAFTTRPLSTAMRNVAWGNDIQIHLTNRECSVRVPRWLKRAIAGPTAEEILADSRRVRSDPSARRVSREQALRHSAVWACLRLRADLISTMPIDVFRRDNTGAQIEIPKPPILVTPGGNEVRMVEWMYSTQFDTDSCGNTFGVISERDALGIPARIDLVPYTDVVVQVRDGKLRYRVAGSNYEPREIWHEKQFTMSGLPVGLSPIGFAAYSINGYLSAQAFAAEWFSSSAVPTGRLKNTEKTIDSRQAQIIKERFKNSVLNGDVFVHGKDWDYEMIAAKASESQFLEERQFGVADVCRFFGVPGDMVDAATPSGHITYATVTQRNLQLLIHNLGPAITRREEAISWGLLPRPRYVKFNTNALLRMDLKGRYDSYKVGIEGRFLTPSEARELEDRPPLTPDQIDEFGRLFPAKAPQPTGPGVAA